MESLLKEAVNAGGVIFLATVGVFLWTKYHEQNQKEMQEMVREQQADKNHLAAVLESNTKANTELIMLVREIAQMIRDMRQDQKRAN